MDPKFSEKYPALWEYLTLTKHEDGAARTPSTLLFFVEEGKLKACLNDRDAQAVCFIASEGFEALLKALEGSLVKGTADWRPARGRRGKG